MTGVLLAGQISVGKTTIAERLAVDFGFRVCSARSALVEATGQDPSDRRALQIAGAAIDVATSGEWLANYVSRFDPTTPIVVDSVRTPNQIHAIREVRQPLLLVYLTAGQETRRSRYEQNEDDELKRSADFERAVSDPLEQAIPGLKHSAHLVLSTDDQDPISVATVIAAAIRRAE